MDRYDKRKTEIKVILCAAAVTCARIGDSNLTRDNEETNLLVRQYQSQTMLFYLQRKQRTLTRSSLHHFTGDILCLFPEQW